MIVVETITLVTSIIGLYNAALPLVRQYLEHRRRTRLASTVTEDAIQASLKLGIREVAAVYKSCIDVIGADFRIGDGRARDELLMQKAMLETLVRLLEAAINGGELDAGKAQAIADDARVGSTKALAGQFLRMQQAAKKLARSPQDFLRRLFSSARNAPSEPEGPPACPGPIAKVKKRLVQTYLICSGCKLSINATKCREHLRYILLGHMEAKAEDTPDLMSFVCKFCPIREQFKLDAFKMHVEQLHPWVRVLGGHLEEELLQQTDKDHVSRVSTANTT